jgi:hypothetical protein
MNTNSRLHTDMDANSPELTFACRCTLGTVDIVLLYAGLSLAPLSICKPLHQGCELLPSAEPLLLGKGPNLSTSMYSHHESITCGCTGIARENLFIRVHYRTGVLDTSWCGKDPNQALYAPPNSGIPFASCSKLDRLRNI